LNNMVANQKVLGIEWDDNSGNGSISSSTTTTTTASSTTTTTTTTRSHNRMVDDGDDDEKEERFAPGSLPSTSRTGRSSVTGHRIKIWDRNWVFRGDPENPLECPSGKDGATSSSSGLDKNNWIAMPSADPRALLERNKLALTLTRVSSTVVDTKLALFDIWDEGCGKKNQSLLQ
jgi:hypothetical protein